MSSNNNFPALVAPSQIGRMTQRNVGIIHMILNRIGVPDSLHEFVIALYVSGNWDNTEWDEISLMRMARNISSNESNFKSAYYRLKRRSPEFFRWQEGQWFRLVEREKAKDRMKTKSKYKLLIYKEITHLVEMPLESFQKNIRAEVDKVFWYVPEEANLPKEGHPRESKGAARRAAMALKRLVECTNSIQEARDLLLQEISDDNNFVNVSRVLGVNT